MSADEELSPTQTLRPFYSATPSPQVTTIINTPVPLPTQKATATPWIHRIQANDTLSGIAARYGVDLADLLAANPEIDPQFLSLDMEIRIPIEGSGLEGALSVTVTPFPLPIIGPDCYQTFGNELWCITGIENNAGIEMEGLSALFTLYDQQGRIITSRLVYAPLNLLPDGRIMPLAASFEWDEVNTFSFARAAVASGFPANQSEERYAQVEVKQKELVLSEDGTRASWTGELVLNGDQTDKPIKPTVLLVAYDRFDSIVGFRKVELSEGAAGSQEFQAQLYSMNPVIDRIEVLAEALYITE